MAYEKFSLNFTLIDQIVYEIITNQFPYDLKNIFAKKELSVYCIEKKNMVEKNQLISLFRLQT